MTFKCKRCGIDLGEMDKGRIRNGVALLCSSCWQKAEVAIQMADLASKSSSDLFGKSDDVVKDLFGKFGMGGKI